MATKLAELEALLEKARAALGRAQTRGARDRSLFKIAKYQAEIKTLIARGGPRNPAKIPKKIKNKDP